MRSVSESLSPASTLMSRSRLRAVLASAAALAVIVAVSPAARAQRAVPFRNGIPVAPSGIPVPPLPDKPVAYETAEGQDIRVVVFTRGLTQPWSIAFLPDGRMLVTERGGALRIVEADGTLVADPVVGVPEVRPAALAGLLDVALHPHFADNGLVYLSYSKPNGDSAATLAVARGVFDGKALRDVDDVFVAGSDTSGVSRLAFGPDGLLYVSTSGGNAQDPNSHSGKVLRLMDDGSVPSDNPFIGRDGYQPEIFTLGHRSTLGLAFHPLTGELWQNENGPNGGDEINILKAGANYGWPLVSLGRTYPGPLQSEEFTREGFENPIVYWVPSIAVSGMTFYTGDRLPRWKGDVFVGGLRTGEIPGTGHVERILFNENTQELRRESLLVDLRQRVRDIRMGPDELLYVLTGEDEGAILRIEPGS
jgi:aldose sugar dehydrogenase